VPRITHSLSEMVSELKTKITALKGHQTAIRDAISRDVGIQVNTEALQQVTKSLAAAQIALVALEEGCCIQNCEIDWVAPPPAPQH
jgi:hypothetical protein